MVSCRFVVISYVSLELWLNECSTDWFVFSWQPIGVEVQALMKQGVWHKPELYDSYRWLRVATSCRGINGRRPLKYSGVGNQGINELWGLASLISVLNSVLFFCF